MCGIYGIVKISGSQASVSDVLNYFQELLRQSESRGREASGIAINTDHGIQYYKAALPATKLLQSPAYDQLLQSSFDQIDSQASIAMIGHARLVTNGTQGQEENNQPVASEFFLGMHNGIVVNEQELWEKHSDLTRSSRVDTEVIYKLMDTFYKKSGSIHQATTQMFTELEGEASLAFFARDSRVLGLATNVGNLYYTHLVGQGLFLFASERYFIKKVLSGAKQSEAIVQIKAGTGVFVEIERGELQQMSLEGSPQAELQFEKSQPFNMRSFSAKERVLTRCSRCILPHTFPFIEFDHDGVCHYCRTYQPFEFQEDVLKKLVDKHRSPDGRPDCIVALSGGRDSCFGLHYIKKVLGLHPIAYTYDWAMVTAEARRNCARMCGQLGIEHIIRSADILQKRRNIRVNIEAWLRRPDLGMIPLFMAGDKQFFYFAKQVSRQTEIPLVFFCGGNPFEVTHFKTGFCGVQDQSQGGMLGLSLTGKAKLLAYYGKNFLLNPRYLNRSLLDTMFAFYSTYIDRGEYVYLYRHLKWDEAKIASTLEQEYGWESAGDSTSTWRIGDGTASFYNYIYHSVAGFSEHDTFRSHQIRAGILSREEALALCVLDNQPRYESMKEYAQLVGFNLDEALSIINNIPKLY